MLDILHNWRLARKLSVAFTLIAAIIVSLGTTAIISHRSLSAAERDAVQQALPTATSVSRLLGYLREYRILMYSHMDAVSEAETAKLEKRVADNKANIGNELNRLNGIINPALSGDLANVRSAITELDEVNGVILALSRQHRHADTLALLKGDGLQASHKALDNANALMQRSSDLSTAAGEKANRFAVRMFMLIAALVAASIGLLFLIWYSLNRTFARPMDELSHVTTDLAEGRDVSVPHRDRQDELGSIAKAVDRFRLAAEERQTIERTFAEERATVTTALGESLAALAHGDLTAEVRAEFPAGAVAVKAHFNQALANLREMIGSVSDSAVGIRTGSGEIAQAADDLARRTESSAASLEETSAALAQIDERLKATAAAASQTVQRADQAIATVGGGRSIADEAVQAMERVRESATGIDSVIEGLDKIAFQTRVLAMNAAVEAGRAGDAGRGFAVVADLVSSLAMRAEEEAKRARDQLSVTQTDIVAAVGAVQRVDGALANISGDVNEVHLLLGNMASDNQAQSAAISQISVAIGTMDQSTQQNAAMVEETSAAARNLMTEVTALAERAALFKTDAQGEAAKPARLASAKPERGYVSPVKPLPSPAKARVSGNTALSEAANEDWSDF